MRIGNLLLTFVLLLSFQAFSQVEPGPAGEFKVVWGKPYELPKKYTEYGYLGNLKEGIIQISTRGTKNVLIQRFSLDNLTPTNSFDIDLSEMPGHFVTDLFTYYNGNYYMFYSTWDKEKKRENLFADKIDMSNGSLANDPKRLIRARKIAGTLIATGFYKFSTADKFNFRFSIDSSFLLVTYRRYTEVKNDAKHKDVLGFYVFDKDLNNLWGGEYRMPHTEEMMDNVDYMVDKKGDAYLLSKVYKGHRKEKNGDRPNYYYELLKFGKDYEEPKKISIELTDKFINDMSISENFEGEMVCAGFYRSNYKSKNKSSYTSNNTDGAFLITIENDTVTDALSSYYEFPLETIKQFEKKSTRKKADKKDKSSNAEVPSLEIREVTMFDDGSIVFVGEQYHVVERTTTDSKGYTTTHVRYYYDDIYAMKVSKDKNIEWIKKIPKRQKGVNGRGGMSFMYFANAGNNYFIYLDNIKNLHLPSDKEPAVHADGHGGFFTICKIDSKGNVTKDKLFDLRDKELVLWPADLQKISDNVIIGRAVSKKKSKMMKIIHEL